MARKPVSTNSPNGVSAGQTATIDLPVGNLVYHSLLLRYQTSTAGGATKTNIEAEIDEVRLKVNGKVQRVFSAAQLYLMNAFNGRPAADYAGDASNPGTLPIFFGEPWRRTAQGEDALAWGMADVDTFQVEIDIASGATSPTLDSKVIVDHVGRPMGPIVKWRRFQQPISATGITTNTNLPRNDDYLGLFGFSANIADVEVKIDQLESYKLTAAEQIDLQLAHGKTPQTGLFAVDFDFTDRVAETLRMKRSDGRPVSEFRVDWNMSSATSFTLISETLGLRD